ncbi:hypothetical protein F4808DRAFT_432488 [Astrocystis sublimbata]|nr:hypothetical protein F4808DRAFT_432488 [Astrocystis sublimbata]
MDILNGLSIPPPDGYESNLDNPPNANYLVVPIITLCVVLSALAFAIRFYAKYVGKKLMVADYLTFVAFPIFVTYIYYIYKLSWTGGYLVHMWDIRLKDAPAFNFITFLATLLYLWIIALIKCAILLEWVAIFVPTSERNYFTWASWATCLAFAILSIVIFVLDLVNCTPFEANWNPLVPGGSCRFRIAQFGLASATTNFLLDLVPIFLAQKVIWGLRMPTHQKWSVSLIFLIGFVGCAASIVRLYYSTRFYVSNDVSYYFSILAITSLAETTAANIVLCAPHISKALLGLKHSKAAKAVKRYRTSKTSSACTDNSRSYHELREHHHRDGKLREHWFMSSKVDGAATRRSSLESGEPLSRPDAIYLGMYDGNGPTIQGL